MSPGTTVEWPMRSRDSRTKTSWSACSSTLILKQVEASAKLGVDAVELHTGPYALARREAKIVELARLSDAGKVTSAAGMRLHAGHGLNYTNVRDVAAIPKMAELNIGHAIISRAVMVGMKEAVAEMRRILDLSGR